MVATKESLAFYDPADVVKAGASVWTDEDEWSVSTCEFKMILVFSTTIPGLVQDWRSNSAHRVEEVG